MSPLDPFSFKSIVFFTGAGMSQESGIPTYRGQGGVWDAYRYQDYACRDAFERDPERVIAFHEIRRKAIFSCSPHRGHTLIADLERRHPGVVVVTQNIDGMHQRAGSTRVVELHGSIFRVRCPVHGVWDDVGEAYKQKTCETCGARLRPDIVWFGDMLDPSVIDRAIGLISTCDLFVGIGTSAVVWPAAGFPEHAAANKALTVEINPEPTGRSGMYDITLRDQAGSALAGLFRV
ncbi:NAD-dependent protein deacetylase [Desulfatiferula olefinivorans]